MLRLSFTTKMPCPSFALPAGLDCNTGKKLMQVQGSVCKSCYARKGHYVYPAAAKLRQDNLRETKLALRSPLVRERWVATLTGLIYSTGTAWFRWHDSGDILAELHLHMIFDVCLRTPEVRHWIPTREYGFVQSVLFGRQLPRNCTIRLSAHMIGDVLPSKKLPTSSVGAFGYACPATYDASYEGNCRDCRACWDRRVKNVDYRKH